MKSIIKRIFGKIHRTIDPFLVRISYRSHFLSTLYYSFFSSKFRREHHAVLNGRVKHLDESIGNKSNLYTLIRNTHRIEKGLLMKPRREIFAVDFVAETMDNFETLYGRFDCAPGTQMKWTYDVLTEYFAVTGTHVVIDKQRERFYKVINSRSCSNSPSIPYKRLEENRPNISYESFYQLTKYRRSVRWFQDRNVPHDLVDQAILAANQSPSACNRQPFSFRIVDDPSLLPVVANIPGGVKGYAHNIPMFVVVVGNLDAYFDERDRHVIYVDGSLASMTFMLALETLGLSSCAINWPDVENFERQMESALKLNKWQRPIMCMAVGYPDPEGLVAFSEKRDLEDIRKYN
jgi:nitroreductase